MRGRGLVLLALGLLALQVGFHRYSQHYLPELGIVPPVPSTAELGVTAMGDAQYLFRIHTLELQQAGDTFGRVTALYKYDYPALRDWFMQMDTLDARSHFFPALASYYFAQSQHKEDVAYLVDYLDAHTKHDIEHNWWWVVQAAYLSKHKLGDSDRAITIAKRLEGVTSIPLWAQQYPAFIYEQRGEFDDALRIIQDIIASQDDLKPQDLAFMAQFAKTRLKSLETAEKIQQRLQKETTRPPTHTEGAH